MQFRQTYLINQQRIATASVEAEKAIRVERTIPCSDKSDELFGDIFKTNLSVEQISAKAEWISKCVKATVPVDEFSEQP